MVLSSKLDFKFVLKKSGWRLAGLLVVSTAVYITKNRGYNEISVDILPASILGIALSILLGFKINSAYSRWWDARKLWGELTNESRSLGLILIAFSLCSIPLRANIEKIIRRQIDYVNTLNSSLRKINKKNILNNPEIIESGGIQNQKNKPLEVLLLQSADITVLLKENKITNLQHAKLEDTLSRLIDAQGGCERIKATPFPNSYTFHLNLFIILYSYLLPFVMVGSSDWHTIPASVIIGYVFFSLSTIASIMENPFESGLYAIPMNAICRTIEINLLSMCGDLEPPPPLLVENGYIE